MEKGRDYVQQLRVWDDCIMCGRPRESRAQQLDALRVHIRARGLWVSRAGPKHKEEARHLRMGMEVKALSVINVWNGVAYDGV